MLQLESAGIFLEPPVVEAARDALPGATGVLTYLANELRVGKRACPYAFVAAVGPLDRSAATPPLPAGMKDDEVVITRWLADDLQAKPGDTLAMRYFVFGLLFVIFDVEAVFLFPWAIVAESMGVFGLVAVILFILTLLEGLLYAIRKGVLTWE